MNIKTLKKAELINLVMELQEENTKLQEENTKLQEENTKLKGAINNLFELANGKTEVVVEPVVKEPVEDDLYKAIFNRKRKVEVPKEPPTQQPMYSAINDDDIPF